MTDIRALMENTNGHRGFLGAEYIDSFPGMTLTEAASHLPCIVVESQIEMLPSSRTMRIGLDENAIQALQESALGTLKDKIEAFFAPLLKWIRSIIAKLKVHIDKKKLTGEELYRKYADRLDKDAAYQNVTFNGYRFGAGSKAIRNIRDSFDINIEGFVKSGLEHAGIHNVILPRDFGTRLRALARKIPEGETISKEKQSEISEDIDSITDLARDERVTAMASVLAGRTLPNDWEDSIRDAAWGEKGEIQYGTDMFNPRMIGLVLKDNSLSDCLEGYRRLERAIKDYRGRLKGELADLWDEFYSTTDTLTLPGNLSTQALINRYYNAYISCVADALNAATRLKSIKVDFYTQMHKQAVSMLVRLVNHGAGPVNDSYSGEEDWA